MSELNLKNKKLNNLYLALKEIYGERNMSTCGGESDECLNLQIKLQGQDGICVPLTITFSDDDEWATADGWCLNKFNDGYSHWEFEHCKNYEEIFKKL